MRGELALAAGVALGSAFAAYAAAALLVLLAAIVAHASRTGRAGAPCGCFGPRSRVGRWTALRNVLLAAAFLGLPSLPGWAPGVEAWLALGVGVLVVAVAALAVAVLALAREVGVLRLRLAPEGALELAHEGPPLGQRTPLIERFSVDSGTRFALAVFSSPACRLCRSLAPAIASFGRDPLVSLRVFDEEADAEAWSALGVPGSPFAVALDRDGVVRAKGTFNSFGQLESVLAAAERRVLAGGHA